MYTARESRSTVAVLNDQLGAARGLLIELLGYRANSLVSRLTQPSRIEWSYERSGQEIDVLICDKKTITFIECKKQQDISGQGARLKEKASVLMRDPGFLRDWGITDNAVIEYTFLTWDSPHMDVVTELQGLGISLRVLGQDCMGLPRRVKDRLKVALDSAPDTI
jgi:hypothetical protein